MAAGLIVYLLDWIYIVISDPAFCGFVSLDWRLFLGFIGLYGVMTVIIAR